MRWRFPIALSPTESTERARMSANIEAWWTDFAAAWPAIHASFHQKGSFDVAEFMGSAFQARVHPEVMWEFGALPGGGEYLALCPEARKDLAPLVDAVVARAPRIDGLHVQRGRPPNTMEAARSSVDARTRGGIPPRVRAEREPDRPVVALTWETAPGDTDTKAAFESAFVATEALLGEEVLDIWIGPIDVVPPPTVGWFGKLLGRAPPPNAEPVETLVDRVAAHVAALKAARPAAPYGAELADSAGTLYQGQPRIGALAGRGDLILVQSRVPLLAAALLGGGTFYSERHSRHGELFAYVKLSRDPADRGREVEERSRYEDALFAALTEAGLGAAVGAGTGTTFSYVDLALSHPDDALPVVRRVLQTLGAPKETWILFFDSTLSEEWVGAWDDTPPPPVDPPSALEN